MKRGSNCFMWNVYDGIQILVFIMQCDMEWQTYGIETEIDFMLNIFSTKARQFCLVYFIVR